jgi:diguanylate cyclase (GGDEF)-like protein
MSNYLNEDRVFQALKSIISVALVYFLLSELSFHISSVTDFTQSLSLNGGFALAVMLAMAHSRALTGIVLGALSLSFYHLAEIEIVNSEVLLQAIIPAFTVAIQAYIGLKIYRRWVSVDNSLSHDDDLLRFLKVLPLIAAINTLLSIFTSQWLTSSSPEIFISAWIELWIGHLLGLILVIPVVFSLLEHKNALWQSRKHIIVPSFVVTLTITFLVCSNIKQYENSRLEDRFKIITNQTASLFYISLKEKELLQASVAQFFISSQEVTRAEFKLFVTGLSLQNKYIQVVEWLPKIKDEQRSEYEKSQSEYYGEDFSITEVIAKGVIIPATKRDVYYPITFLEPEWDNTLAIGFDPSGSSVGKAFIKKAIISGGSQGREPVKIVINSGFKSAFIVYKPVYTNLDGTKTLDPSEGEVLGFVNIVVRVEDFIETVVGSKETANFNLEWQDTESGKYYFDTNVQDFIPFKHVIDINVSGRDMKLIFSPTELFIEQTTTQVVAIAMVTSLVVACLFGILILNITARTSRIQSEVKLRTEELEIANQQLELLSNKDVLTDLFNRRYFENALHDEFERSRRYNRTFALIMFDIDNFKKINDQYGHPCGDQVIKAIADYLINTSRSSDVLSRIGGEEFTLILPAQSEANIMSIIERIRIDISNIKVKYDEHTVQFTCSFGIAIFDQNVKDIHTFIKMADQAMYKAKKMGRNRTELFSEP